MEGDELIQNRKLKLDDFVNESFSVNVDFAERLGVPEPHEILMNFDRLKDFIYHIVHPFIKEQIIQEEDRIWIITRLGYLLGEYFKEKYAGYWAVNENKDSSQFGRYVVFASSPTTTSVYPIDVFEAVTELVDQERDLIRLITEIEEVIQ